MQDKDLYQQILGLESLWRVAGVSVDVAEQEIVVAVEHAPETRLCCPECGLELACCDHRRSRERRHLDSCQFRTILWAALPRAECPEHGVRQVRAPGGSQGWGDRAPVGKRPAARKSRAMARRLIAGWC